MRRLLFALIVWFSMGCQLNEVTKHTSGASDASSQGKSLYGTHCAGCHGPLGSTPLLGKSFDDIRSEIRENPVMGHLAVLTDDQVREIVSALGSSTIAGGGPGTGADFAFQNGNVFPAWSLAGASFRITTKFVANKSYSGVNIRVTLRGPTGTVVGTKEHTNQNVSPSSPLQLEYIYDSVETSAVGQYKMQIEMLQGSAVLAPAITADAFYLYAPIRIVAGSTMNYTDSMGRVWSPDMSFTGGNVLSPFPAVTAVAGTADSYLYNGLRWGEFNYKFVVPAGAKYKVQLLFAENFVTAAGQRLFNVNINGNRVLTNFDIFAESGGMWRALNKTFSTQAMTDGTIQIDFIRGPIQDPKAGAILITGDQL